MNLPGPCFVLLLAIGLMIVGAIGLGGVIESEAQARGTYELIKDWQTLVGIGGAVIAAWIAAKPVWAQLLALNKQNDHKTHELLVSRSISLNTEKIATQEVFTRVCIISSLFDRVEQKNWTIDPNAYAYMQAAQEILSTAILKYEIEIGRVWGSAALSETRREYLDCSFRFENAFSNFMVAVNGNFHSPVADGESLVSNLRKWAAEVARRAPMLDEFIKTEVRRGAAKIENIESRIVG